MTHPVAPDGGGEARPALDQLTLKASGIEHGFIDVHDNRRRQLLKIFLLLRQRVPLTVGEGAL